MTEVPLKAITGGGLVMIPLIITSLVIWYLIIERLTHLRNEKMDMEAFMSHLLMFLEQNKREQAHKLCDLTPGPLSRIIASALRVIEKRRESVERIIREASLSETPGLLKNLSVIGILAAVTPLLGLLGTVSGMVTTFRAINLYGTGDPEALAGGISEALITTQYGLIIGIPGIMFYFYLSSRTDNLIKDIDKQILKFLNGVKQLHK
ncbi:MAG: MotA/TolQ/ExbB proton channel family protein [Deltaproteobacteria bacterium]|nr:MAG: MotA/TolQ/ExbB proton channel family protein [Deltaproteobacteria bacterium]